MSFFALDAHACDHVGSASMCERIGSSTKLSVVHQICIVELSVESSRCRVNPDAWSLLCVQLLCSFCNGSLLVYLICPLAFCKLIRGQIPCSGASCFLSLKPLLVPSKDGCPFSQANLSRFIVRFRWWLAACPRLPELAHQSF